MEVISFILVCLGMVFLIFILVSISDKNKSAAVVNALLSACLFMLAALAYYIIIPSGNTDKVYNIYKMDNKSARVSKHVWLVKKQCRYNKYRANDICREVYAKPIKQVTLDKIVPGQ